MKDNQPNITIIGAGASGLAAAITLKKSGYHCTVLEQAKSVGGRVQTLRENGLLLDDGFQVLLDAYPALPEFLDLPALNLIKFLPGSMIFKDGKTYKLGDPRRNASFFWKTIYTGVGSFKDKWLVFSLSRKLKNKSVEAIFQEPETRTLDYLQDYGFSSKIIHNFFKPFYAGIFLETELSTSSRMFEFVFKMFNEGNATLPAKGIQAIPEQMASQLAADQIKFEQKVDSIQGNTIIMEDGQQFKSDFTIVATPAGSLVPNLSSQDLDWHQVTVLYFETDHAGFNEPIIGLVPNEDCLINNFHFLNDIFDNHRNVISISVVKPHNLSDQQLAERVVKELREETGIKANELVRCFHIPKALPQLESLNYAMPPSETQLNQHVFLAGDQLSNGSLNAALLNGKAAAQAVIAKIEDRVLV
ncbi:FAD-dependent oxidoreductase [Nonlabens xiamenensis]|uniref:FAD-dependent oxidoreductase n=1 Tax=Nonlabens xiamenensis TaxID=2341043 RepID=UPI000F60D830|nr:FAD-dependent oxidoreductase [Nonlabens xiamenensis]